MFEIEGPDERGWVKVEYFPWVFFFIASSYRPIIIMRQDKSRAEPEDLKPESWILDYAAKIARERFRSFRSARG